MTASTPIAIVETGSADIYFTAITTDGHGLTVSVDVGGAPVMTGIDPLDIPEAIRWMVSEGHMSEDEATDAANQIAPFGIC